MCSSDLPVDRKMAINALNSGAQCWMADFEDANSPTWDNVINGQINLRDAVRRTITYTSPEGKAYALKERTAVMICRPRGWHMEEKHALLDGERVPASLFDWGLLFFHNARELVARGSGPYYYLPKMESHLEARLWNDVFRHAQDAVGLPRGTIRATVLIETITAAFEAEEILYELREHASGLNCGRWDYMFSFVKKLRTRPEYLFPDRTLITMESPFLRAYVTQVIQVCHRRGAYAMGGMAAQIPIKGDPAANAAAVVEDATTALGRHPGAKTMLANTTNLRGLILALHKKGARATCGRRTLSIDRGPSILFPVQNTMRASEDAFATRRRALAFAVSTGGPARA